MRSVLSIFLFLAIIFATSALDVELPEVEEDEQPDCGEELWEANKLVEQMNKNIKACEYKEEMHEKVRKLSEQSNAMLNQSMQAMRNVEDKPVPKNEKWGEEKESLLEQMADIEDELNEKIKKYEKQEKAMRNEIDILQAQIAAMGEEL